MNDFINFVNACLCLKLIWADFSFSAADNTHMMSCEVSRSGSIEPEPLHLSSVMTGLALTQTFHSFLLIFSHSLLPEQNVLSGVTAIV